MRCSTTVGTWDSSDIFAMNGGGRTADSRSDVADDGNVYRFPLVQPREYWNVWQWIAKISVADIRKTGLAANMLREVYRELSRITSSAFDYRREMHSCSQCMHRVSRPFYMFCAAAIICVFDEEIRIIKELKIEIWWSYSRLNPLMKIVNAAMLRISW